MESTGRGDGVGGCMQGKQGESETSCSLRNTMGVDE